MHMFIFAGPPGIPELPCTQFRIPAVLHTLFPTLRLLLTIPLYAALVNPRVKFVPTSDATREADEGASPSAVENTALLDPQKDDDAEDHGLGLVTSKKPAQYGTFGTSRLSVPSSTTQTRSTSRNSGAGQRGPQVWTALSFDNHFLANIKFYRDSRLVLSTSGWTRLLLKTSLGPNFWQGFEN